MNKKYVGIIYTILSAICFATGGVLLKVNSWSSLSVSGFRSFFALLIFIIYMIIKKHPMKWNLQVWIGAIANSLMSLLFIMAVRMTTAANAIVLQFTMPIYIIVFLWVLEKKKPQKASLIATFFCLVGIAFFFFDSISAEGMLGNICALASGFFYAIVFVIKRIPKSDFESSAVLSFAMNFLLGIPFLISEADFGATNIWTGVALGVIQIGCAYIFLNAALNKVSPIAVSLLSMVEPILNPILVAVFYGEMIGGISLIGAGIVLISAFCYNLVTKDG